MKAGVGLKASHYREVLATTPDIGFFEVHAENFMGAGGPPHRYLAAIRERYPLSIHGVGLSLGSAEPLDRAHLERLKQLLSRYEPRWFSEHLAWSTHSGRYFNDLLPVRYDARTLQRVCEHIDATQNFLRRPMLLENPSTYVHFHDSTMDEPTFIAAIVRRTGCGLLFDVNNAYVSAVNQGREPSDYLAAYPLEAAQEIHLAGHAERITDSGSRLLIDDHGSAVVAAVWQLYAAAICRRGPLPTLIEWDSRVPAWEVLRAEAAKADAVAEACSPPAQEAFSRVGVA